MSDGNALLNEFVSLFSHAVNIIHKGLKKDGVDIPIDQLAGYLHPAIRKKAAKPAGGPKTHASNSKIGVATLVIGCTAGVHPKDTQKAEDEGREALAGPGEFVCGNAASDLTNHRVAPDSEGNLHFVCNACLKRIEGNAEKGVLPSPEHFGEAQWVVNKDGSSRQPDGVEMPELDPVDAAQFMTKCGYVKGNTPPKGSPKTPTKAATPSKTMAAVIVDAMTKGALANVLGDESEAAESETESTTESDDTVVPAPKTVAVKPVKRVGFTLKAQ